jgi:1-aminocyclopropane-1-carboxylate deaminase/D-cysteine desulfhydrase-like pyridoxal-dependent ACC family enzyme
MTDLLTPVELHDGIWVKREDLYRNEMFGVNGAKYRACQHLIGRASLVAHTVVSASSVLSPQAAMAAVVANENAMECRIIVGGTTPEKAMRHRSIAIAVTAGATVEAIAVGYNPALQSAAQKTSQAAGHWRLPYGISTPPDATVEELRAFVSVGAPQTENLPNGVERLVLPLGSGNTACGVLYGLHDARPSKLKQVVTVGIGPERVDWVRDRLAALDRDMVPRGVEHLHIPLHPWWATYGDRMPETWDGIRLHGTYEGKIYRFIKTSPPLPWWRQDGTTAFWIVGGPL